MNPAPVHSKFKRTGRWFLLAAVWAMTGACTEKIDWELEYQEADVIVVEGKITNDTKAHEVKLSLPVYETNAAREPVTGATVVINDGRQIHALTEDPERPGIYLTGPGFAGEVNRGYQLRIRHGDRHITAIAFMREVLPFQFMRPHLVQSDPPLYEVYISDQNGPAIVRMELDWSHVPGYDALPRDETHALIYHYTLGSVDVNRIFAPDREHVRFPPGTIVFREKESVSREYEEFLRGMLSETDWRGGVFDVLPGNARSNLSEGAIGYFTAGEVIRDTVVI
ncbi:MAG: DUF4249 family protein, partial [Bacteroidales bacterium]|nr:DUF4249 family protein [Bacteroidales bacterium]